MIITVDGRNPAKQLKMHVMHLCLYMYIHNMSTLSYLNSHWPQLLDKNKTYIWFLYCPVPANGATKDATKRRFDDDPMQEDMFGQTMSKRQNRLKGWLPKVNYN